MAIICEAYTRETLGDSSHRIVLKFKPHLSPFKAAVIPAVDDATVRSKALEIKRCLQDLNLGRVVLERGNVPSMAYSRHDEAGTPVCIAVTAEALNERGASVAVRDRDTMEIAKVLVEELPRHLTDRINATPISGFPS